MSKRHMPADDFDRDAGDASHDRTTPRPEHAGRRIRTRKVVGDGAAVSEELIVDCPAKDHWPTFQECLACERFRGYSLDVHGGESHVSCARASGPPFHAPGAAGGCAERTPVTAIMSDPLCVRTDVTLDELAALFVERGISGLPVVDAEGSPVGVVSKTDLVEAQAGHMAVEPASGKRPRTARGKKLAAGFQEDRRSLLTASELMTPVVFKVVEGASVADAAALMAEKRVHRIPVVSRCGHVVGIVTALDIARWVGRNRRAPSARR